MYQRLYLVVSTNPGCEKSTVYIGAPVKEINVSELPPGLKFYELGMTNLMLPPGNIIVSAISKSFYDSFKPVLET